MAYGGWGAIALAALGFAVTLTTILSGGYPPALALALTGGYLVLGVVGWQLGRARHEWNAWVLMALSVLDIIFPLLRDESITGLLWKVAAAVLFVRGYMAIVEYHELGAAIRERERVQESSAPS
jgi:hypothetical protein